MLMGNECRQYSRNHFPTTEKLACLYLHVKGTTASDTLTIEQRNGKVFRRKAEIPFPEPFVEFCGLRNLLATLKPTKAPRTHTHTHTVKMSTERCWSFSILRTSNFQPQFSSIRSPFCDFGNSINKPKVPDPFTFVSRPIDESLISSAHLLPRFVSLQFSTLSHKADIPSAGIIARSYQYVC